MILLNVGDKVKHERFDLGGMKTGEVIAIEQVDQDDWPLIRVGDEFQWDRPPTNYKKKENKSVFPLTEEELKGVFYTIKYDGLDDEEFGYETPFEESGCLELI